MFFGGNRVLKPGFFICSKMVAKNFNKNIHFIKTTPLLLLIREDKYLTPGKGGLPALEQMLRRKV